MQRARREEVFVRPKKGHDEVNLESDESLSIVTETELGMGRVSLYKLFHIGTF